MEGKEMKELMNWIKEEESGQGLVEYALIVGLIALICIGAIKATGKNVSDFWDELKSGTDSL
jgi:pilus assembly protein Flp/PilA